MSKERLKDTGVTEGLSQNRVRDLGLMERLDQMVQQEPGKFSPENIQRVRQFVQYEAENPNNQRPFRLFREVTDYAFYHRLHPKWQGRSSKEMIVDKESGAGRFYSAFLKWATRVAGKDKKMKRELIGKIFSQTHYRWQFFTTIEDWLDEFNNHPEWQGRSPQDMAEDKESRASAFYGSFKVWVRKTAKKKEERESLRMVIFSSKIKHKDRNLSTIEEWLEEFQLHPEWHGKSTQEIQKDKESAAFYVAFVSWARKEAENEERRKELREQIFPSKQSSWMHLKTIEDWMDEFAIHPEWHGRSPVEMSIDKESGGAAFYYAFSVYVRKTAKNIEEREVFKDAIFPNRKIYFNYKHLTTINEWLEEFKNHPEWQGRKPTEMRTDKESGASAFYGSFKVWVRKTAKNYDEKELFTRTIFPDKRMYPRSDKATNPISPDEAREELSKLLED